MRRTNISASCARPPRVFLVPTAAVSPHTIASPNSRTGHIRQPGTLKNGMANSSFIGPAEAVAKNRIPCRKSTHPVSKIDTYGRVQMARPYVLKIDTYVRPNRVLKIDTYLERPFPKPSLA